MACNPSDARAGGDVELVDVSLAEVTDGFGGVKGGKWTRSPPGDAVSEDSESEDEGKGLLPRGDAGASASTSRDDSSHVTGGLRGYITRVPKGEAVMLAATFTFAFQNVVAKRVERRVPPMEVVFVRSCISGAVTVFTTWRRVVECNAIVRKTNATDPDAPLDAPPAVPGEDFRDDVFTSETLLGSGRFWALCFLRGVAGSIAFSLAYISLTYLTVGDSVAIFFLNPIFSSLMAVPALGEKPTFVSVVAIGGGLLGTLLIVKPPALFHALGIHTGDEATPLDPVGVIVTLFSAFFCAVAMVTIRKVKGRVSALVSFFHLFSYGQLE